MGNFGVVEMVVVGVIALLVFGPERLPEMARTTARFISRFRSEASRAVDELKRAGGLEGLDEEIRSIRDEVQRARSDVTGVLRGPAEDFKRVSSGGPTDLRAGGSDDPGPPPFDREAT